MKKKKICILSNGLWRGGTDTFVINLVQGLDREKYDITVVLSISDDWLAERENEIIDVGARVVRTHGITGKGIKGRVKHLFLLYKHLKKTMPDIFQTNIDLFNGPNLFIAWLAGVPIRICHSHNSMQEREVSGGRNILTFLYQKIMRWMCWKFSNRRAGCSEKALDFLFQDKWKTDSKTRVVNNGIDIENFRTDVNRVKKLNMIGSIAPINILTVGRLSPQKNPLFIADIFVELCKNRDDCNLIWVGIGDMKKEIQQRLETRGVSNRVYFLGIRDDVNELMQCCDAFLFPSMFEGLGIVVIEAQAASLPCLVSREVPQMADCGGCEFLSLEESTEIWAEHLNNILNKKNNFNVSEQKIQKYSIQHMVHQMETLFE